MTIHRLKFLALWPFLFIGCVTTFQTAEVLPPGEFALGSGITFEPIYGDGSEIETVQSEYMEIYFRYGMGEQTDIGIKIGTPLYDDLFEAVHIFGESKYQFRSEPLAVSFLIGGGAFIYDEVYPIIYPTVLIGDQCWYIGPRIIIFDPTSKAYVWGGVLGFAARTFGGRMTILPEINVMTALTRDPDVHYRLGLGIQWHLKPEAKRKDN